MKAGSLFVFLKLYMENSFSRISFLKFSLLFFSRRGMLKETGLLTTEQHLGRQIGAYSGYH